MDLKQDHWFSQLKEDKKAVILDVRTPEEFRKGIIAGAINIDIYKGQGFIYEVEQLDRLRNYYIYCHAGSRSRQACSTMRQLGFDTTYNLEGGLMQWKGAIVLPDV